MLSVPRMLELGVVCTHRRMAAVVVGAVVLAVGVPRVGVLLVRVSRVGRVVPGAVPGLLVLRHEILSVDPRSKPLPIRCCSGV